jgi:hypothetical protein
MTFAVVASTQSSLARPREPSDIKVGTLVEVDGIENERGAIEAKTVRLTAR